MWAPKDWWHCQLPEKVDNISEVQDVVLWEFSESEQKAFCDKDNN